MEILVIHTDDAILGFLQDEPLESLDQHKPSYLSTILDEEVGEVLLDPEDVSGTVIADDDFYPENYSMVDGGVTKV